MLEGVPYDEILQKEYSREGGRGGLWHRDKVVYSLSEKEISNCLFFYQKNIYYIRKVCVYVVYFLIYDRERETKKNSSFAKRGMGIGHKVIHVSITNKLFWGGKKTLFYIQLRLRFIFFSFFSPHLKRLLLLSLCIYGCT